MRSRTRLIEVLETVNPRAVAKLDASAARWFAARLRGEKAEWPIFDPDAITSPHVAELIEQAQHHLRAEG